MTKAVSPSGKKGTVGRNAGQAPLYRIILESLKADIIRGRFPAGTLLPSESELMERFGVSRHTVRAAVRALREARLVESHQGLGTVVKTPGDERGYVHQINSIKDLFPPNSHTQYDPIERGFTSLPAGGSLFAIGKTDDQWMKITGKRFRNNESEPFNELEVYVAARFAGVGRVLGTASDSIYTVLDMIYGEKIGEVEQIIGGFTADGERGLRIGLKKGEVGIEVRRVHRLLSDNQVGIVSFNRYRIDDYTFSMVLRRVD